MNVTEVLALHIDDPDGARHRLFLQTTRLLRCWDCRHTIELPIFAAQTSTPPPFSAPTEPPATPEVVAAAKARALAELERVRQRRTEA